MYVLETMSKYYIDSEVTCWLREWFEADSDVEAIEMAKDGSYITEDVEYLSETNEWNSDDNGEYICEVYDPKDIKIYENYRD